MDYNTSPFPFRMTDELRKEMEALAETNGRSLNQEVTQAVEAHLSGQEVLKGLDKRLKRIEETQAEILEHLKANK